MMEKDDAEAARFVWEVNLLARILHIDPALPPDAYHDSLRHWIAIVRQGVNESDRQFPFLAYGTDWLAFGHLIIALFFVGPLRDPVRNVFMLRAGLAACVLVIPLALVGGPLRGIPVFCKWWIARSAFAAAFRLSFVCETWPGWKRCLPRLPVGKGCKWKV